MASLQKLSHALHEAGSILLEALKSFPFYFLLDLLAGYILAALFQHLRVDAGARYFPKLSFAALTVRMALAALGMGLLNQPRWHAQPDQSLRSEATQELSWWLRHGDEVFRDFLHRTASGALQLLRTGSVAIYQSLRDSSLRLGRGLPRVLEELVLLRNMAGRRSTNTILWTQSHLLALWLGFCMGVKSLVNLATYLASSAHVFALGVSTFVPLACAQVWSRLAGLKTRTRPYLDRLALAPYIFALAARTFVPLVCTRPRSQYARLKTRTLPYLDHLARLTRAPYRPAFGLVRALRRASQACMDWLGACAVAGRQQARDVARRVRKLADVGWKPRRPTATPAAQPSAGVDHQAASRAGGTHDRPRIPAVGRDSGNPRVDLGRVARRRARGVLVLLVAAAGGRPLLAVHRVPARLSVGRRDVLRACETGAGRLVRRQGRVERPAEVVGVVALIFS